MCRGHSALPEASTCLTVSPEVPLCTLSLNDAWPFRAADPALAGFPEDVCGLGGQRRRPSPSTLAFRKAVTSCACWEPGGQPVCTSCSEA